MYEQTIQYYFRYVISLQGAIFLLTTQHPVSNRWGGAFCGSTFWSIFKEAVYRIKRFVQRLLLNDLMESSRATFLTPSKNCGEFMIFFVFVEGYAGPNFSVPIFLRRRNRFFLIYVSKNAKGGGYGHERKNTLQLVFYIMDNMNLKTCIYINKPRTQIQYERFRSLESDLTVSKIYLWFSNLYCSNRKYKVKIMEEGKAKKASRACMATYLSPSSAGP